MNCPTCERDCPKEHTSDHHLRTRKADKNLTEAMCRECHSYIHRLFTNKELADKSLHLDSVEGLLANEVFAKAVKFIKTLPVGRRVKIHESRARRRKRGRGRG